MFNRNMRDEKHIHFNQDALQRFSSQNTEETLADIHAGSGVFSSPSKPLAAGQDLMNLSDHLDVFKESNEFPTIKKNQRGQWSVPWSDLMMTMFILFLVLYMYPVSNRKSMLEREKEKTVDKIPEEKWYEKTGEEELIHPDTIYNQLKTKTVKEIAAIDLLKDTAIKIVLPSDLLFDTGQLDLKATAKQSLSKIAEVIRHNSYIINVVGHTDDIPSHSDRYATNWELSSFRACAVARFLIEEMALPADRFFISSHSYHDPVKPNTSDENRAENRRVEIILYKEKPYGTYTSLDNFLNQ